MSPERFIIHRTDFYRRCYELAKYIFNKDVNKKQKFDQVGEKLYQLCTETNLKHEPFFNNLGNQLNLDQGNICGVTKEVMSDVLNDERNFGRVVSIYTFSLVICRYCNDKETLNNCVDSVLNATAEIMYQNKEWFEEHNSWYGFMDFFASAADKLWKGVFVTTVGLGALAGMIYARS